MILDFLKHFKGSIVYCAIDDKGKSKKPIHFHEGYDLSRKQIITKLKELNKKGYGIFFCVNEIDRRLDNGRQRTQKMLKQIRAVWADDDTPNKKPRTDFTIEPSLVVETSPGKYHYYWLTTTNDIEQWNQVMASIAVTYSTDKNTKDLVRVLRIPGFNHCKKKPVPVKCIDTEVCVYDWIDIVDAFPPIEVSGNDDEEDTFDGFTEARESIVNGSNYHGAIMFLLNHWVNCGIQNKNELFTLINDILDKAENKDERWSKRKDSSYLKNNINDAIKFVKDNPLDTSIVIPTITNEIKQVDLGYPPGLMGKLCTEICDMAPHPNQEIALMAAFSLVAGITGRRYNVIGTGLNLYIALLADSGIGKANLKNSINHALLKVCIMEGGPRFKGPSRVTGPRAIFNMLSKGLCRVCVLEESGLMSQTTSGDQSGITRVLLDIYSSSGYGEYAGGEDYSRKEDIIPIIPSPALTVAHISTPIAYIKALRSKDATLSGEFARIWMIRTMRDKTYLNTNRRKTFTEKIKKQLKSLSRECVTHQDKEHSKVISLGVNGIDLNIDSSLWVDKENQYKHSDEQLRRTLASRAFIKTLKLAAIASVFNGLETVGEKEYDWSKNAIQHEINYIEDTVTYGASDDMLNIVKAIFAPAISKILNDVFNDPKKCPPRRLAEKGIFTASKLCVTMKL